MLIMLQATLSLNCCFSSNSIIHYNELWSAGYQLLLNTSSLLQYSQRFTVGDLVSKWKVYDVHLSYIYCTISLYNFTQASVSISSK